MPKAKLGARTAHCVLNPAPRSGDRTAPARGKPADADSADTPIRVDAARSMASRASRGHDDVGAFTPARASADEALRTTTSQERARAGLESIRRADAAVEAARETARARAAERARDERERRRDGRRTR